MVLAARNTKKYEFVGLRCGTALRPALTRAVEELRLDAHLEGVGHFGVEQIVDAGDAHWRRGHRADARLVEAAAAKAAAPAAVQRESSVGL